MTIFAESSINLDPRNATFARYGKVKLDFVQVRRAATRDDFASVAAIRRAGFARVSDQDPDNVEWVDEVDMLSGTFSLIAAVGGEDIGTLRIQDGRAGCVELQRFVDFMPALKANEMPFAQFARLSVQKSPHSGDAMFSLFKSAWLWCYRERLGGIVLATPIWAKSIYKFMMFRDLGPQSEFRHPFARNAVHYSMAISVPNVEKIWRDAGNPLADEFFGTHHPHLYPYAPPFGIPN